MNCEEFYLKIGFFPPIKKESTVLDLKLHIKLFLSHQALFTQNFIKLRNKFLEKLFSSARSWLILKLYLKPVNFFSSFQIFYSKNNKVLIY